MLMRTLLEGRLLLAATFAAAVGVYRLRKYPVEREQVFLAVIDARRPEILYGLAQGVCAFYGSRRGSASRRCHVALRWWSRAAHRPPGSVRHRQSRT